MKKNVYIIITLSALFYGCSSKPDYAQLNKENSLKHITNIFEKNRVLDTYKAIAVVIDDNGKSAIGYSHDAKSQQSANERAINHCNLAKQKTNLQSECTIYAEGDTIVKEL